MADRLLLDDGDWVIQPQGDVRLNPDNALARRLILHLPLNGVRHELVTGKPITLGGNALFRPGKLGVGLLATGSGGIGSVPLNLSDQSAVTLSFHMLWNAFANNDALAMEFGSPNFSAANGILVDPNEGGFGRFQIAGVSGPSGAASAGSFVRPAAGVWLHYVIGLDRTIAGLVSYVLINGVSQTIFREYNNVAGGNFGNSSLFLFSRNNGALFGAGQMQGLSFFRGLLSQAEARSLYVRPYQIYAPPVFERRRAASTPTVIAANVGAGAGAGTTASVVARTIIAAGAGTASGQGTVAVIAEGTRIAATVGTAAGAGTTATVAEHTTIAATPGQGAGVGTQAGLTQRTVIQAGAPGAAAGAGTSAQIAERMTIAAGVGEARGDGTAAAITAGGKVLATVGVGRGEGTTATIRVPERIAASVGTAQGAGTQARIAEHTRIAAGVGTAEGRGSEAQIIMPTRIAAVAGAARGLGTTATVAEHTRIDATVGRGAGDGTAAIIDFVTAGGGDGASASQIWAHMLPHGMTARQTMAALHALLAEVHQIHGLRAGEPLVVGPAERRSGGVVQSISESGGVVTMERAA